MMSAADSSIPRQKQAAAWSKQEDVWQTHPHPKKKSIPQTVHQLSHSLTKAASAEMRLK